jgi:hypothetical protein
LFGFALLLCPTAYLLFFVPDASGCFSCRPAKKSNKRKRALFRIAPREKGAMLRVFVVGLTAPRKLSQRFFLCLVLACFFAQCPMDM